MENNSLTGPVITASFEKRAPGPVVVQSRSWFLLDLSNVPRSLQTDTSPANRASLAHVIS